MAYVLEAFIGRPPALARLVGESRATALSARQRSGADRLAYVEAELFGGRGEQSAIVWREGYLELGPVTAIDAINRALCALCALRALGALGVQSGEAQDEFDTLGLGRHRRTERWAP